MRFDGFPDPGTHNYTVDEGILYDECVYLELLDIFYLNQILVQLDNMYTVQGVQCVQCTRIVNM